MSTNKVAHLSNFVENIINKKSYEPAHAFHDLWSCTRDVLKVLKLHSPMARAHKSLNALAFILFPMHIAFSEIFSWGPFLESPETLRAIFGCHNSLCNSRTESI